MNQILYTNNNNYNKVDINKIIKIFAIVVLIIALIIVAIKGYEIYKKKMDMDNIIEPEILIENNETKKTTIKVTCENGIQYLIYTWNDENENRVNLNGSTSFERIIDMPEKSINTLKVTVVSMNGTTRSRTQVFENSIDNTKPVIDSMLIEDNKLKIQVSDDNGLKYLAYKWENEEEIIIEAPEEDNKEMTVELDIQRGTYKLQIRVVDIYENEENISKLVTGVNVPEITVLKYGDKVNVHVTHDMGFKKIEFIINNSVYVYDEEFSQYDKNNTTVEYDFPLQEGENLVQIKAYSLEKISENQGETLENYATKTYIGKCTYEP